MTPSCNPLRALVLACLAALCATAAQADIFVSSEKDNAIQQLDGEGKFIRSIPVCKRPRHMEWAARGQRIMVACGDSDQIGVVDIKAGTLIDSVPTGESPEIFALSPDGKTAYVSVEDASELAAYDLVSKKPLFAVKTGAEPEGVLATADGKYVYVTSEVANAVYGIDVAKRKAIGQVKTGMRPRRFAISPDMGELWVSNELGSSISILEVPAMKLKETLKLQVPGMRATDITPVGLIMSPDGKTAWVALGRANHVAEIDVQTRKVRGLALVWLAAPRRAARPRAQLRAPSPAPTGSC